MSAVNTHHKHQAADSGYVSPGMPQLSKGKTTSFFEFWPTAIVYLPVVIQCLFLAIRHRSLTLPLLANPTLPLSGMVGVPKSYLLRQANGTAKEHILAWQVFTRDSRNSDQLAEDIEHEMAEQNIHYPMVCKPDIGCRGAGVKLVHNREELSRSLGNYPVGAGIMIQQLADFEPEAGIFYVREPNQPQGRIISMALKYMPYVVGDGHSTLAELVANDPRAGTLSHLYQPRHQQHWHQVIDEGKPFRLVFSASHCRGAIFKDANHLITPELTQKLDTMLKQIPQFHYGRLDIKFRDMTSLQAGEDLQIVEINTASSESLHIWDSNTTFSQALAALLLQYRLLFRIGAQNRKRGFQTPRLKALLEAWKLERELTKHYPETD